MTSRELYYAKAQVDELREAIAQQRARRKNGGIQQALSSHITEHTGQNSMKLMTTIPKIHKILTCSGHYSKVYSIAWNNQSTQLLSVSYVCSHVNSQHASLTCMRDLGDSRTCEIQDIS